MKLFHDRAAAVALIALAGLVAACTASGGSASPTASASTPGASASASAPASSSAVPTTGPMGSGFYLRAWQTQAIPPRNSFTTLPAVTISGGRLIGGIIAVPAVYPGPLYVSPSVQTISQKGIETIVAEAQRLGLLGSRSDFTEGILPGAIVGHVSIDLNGVHHEITGDPGRLLRCRCAADPGTPAAFASFYQRLTGFSEWLAPELGRETTYEPERLAVLTIPPLEAQAPITPPEVAWPLTTTFAAFGSPFGSATDRCEMVAGSDLSKLLPEVRSANALTRFRDSTGALRSLLVRPLAPGEPAPCEG